ncbi:MAG: protein-L-isoaspartate(D-aspartate) O-methyltransferase [Euryarchaeota archaeon]|nr:protein-L-isoaspartate(D-aspartate) O-methyltransferase [Euryarchaeota archaeon]MBU4608013.1 protein-L-isoaspartate(D-aspartate) O-methyltransferase [Euryarchaeota archaeon]MBV1728656.1 protein-L-isoaspartate(D-aspartate) O-methyltransferase [Methanobacterium sp.]MBV1754738.1 protein-L-isoaspartate(D-aspartate) O-methyltransferase [Methanobacterium sp.]MBV1768225.1 protein-L-isoaspartate(D-aspartate) O-methyltransferase [Methanobacterium sp.]
MSLETYLPRKELVARLESYGIIHSPSVKKAMETVPREEFLPEEFQSRAYLDEPLPIGEGQTISAPHMVAIISEKLALKKGMNVLEIGTGFGYNAAVVAEILGEEGHLFSIERINSLAETAKENLKRTGYAKRVTVIVGDGTRGLPEFAPFSRIYVTAGAPDIPESLKNQLEIGGKLIIPVGSSNYNQELIMIDKISENKFESKNLGGVAFVPLIGEYGW